MVQENSFQILFVLVELGLNIGIKIDIQKNDKKAGFCRGCNKKTSDLVGGHIIKIGTEDRCRYIVPLCSSCNNTKNLEFEVKESDLVSANCENCCNN